MGVGVTNQEFDDFLKYLSQEYLTRPFERLHPPGEESLEVGLRSTLGWLQEADQAVRHVYMSSKFDQPGAIKRDGLRGTLSNIEKAVHFHNDLAERTGVMAIMDQHFVDIARGLRIEHLPNDESYLLSRLGFEHTAENLPGLLYAVRELAERERLNPEKASVSDRLGMIEQDIHKSAGNSAPKKRKWWTGIGKIINGTALSLVDTGIFFGLLPATGGVSFAALASIATGIGISLEGGGALRGE